MLCYIYPDTLNIFTIYVAKYDMFIIKAYIYTLD